MTNPDPVAAFYAKYAFISPSTWKWINFDQPVTVEDLSDLEKATFYTTFHFDDDPLPTEEDLDIPVLKDPNNTVLNYGGSCYIVRPKVKPSGPWIWKKTPPVS